MRLLDGSVAQCLEKTWASTSNTSCWPVLFEVKWTFSTTKESLMSIFFKLGIESRPDRLLLLTGGVGRRQLGERLQFCTLRWKVDEKERTF